MNIWKIEHANKTNQGAKIAICISSSESKGIILQPGEFVLSQEQNTASLDSQKRRGFVNVELFDNSALYLELGVVYKTSILNIPVTPKQIDVVEPAISENLTESEVSVEESEEEFTDKLSKAKKDAADYINKKK